MPAYTYPVFKLYGNRIVLFDLPVEPPRGARAGHQNVKDNKTYTLTASAAKRIKNLSHVFIDTLYTAKPSIKGGKKVPIYFMTVTLPSRQVHCDCTITRESLRPFIQTLEYHYSPNYLYAVERQENGNLHYHFLIDKYIPHADLRRYWNRAINRLGYVDRYQERMVWKYRFGFFIDKEDPAPANVQFKRYMYGIRTNWSNPNSTDIRGKTEDVLRNYIAKYLTKDDNMFCGKMYGANNAVRQLKPYQAGELQSIREYVNNNPGNVKYFEQCAVIKIKSLSHFIKKYQAIKDHYSLNLSILGY